MPNNHIHNHEQQASPERLSNEYLGGLLAAVGNHEAKALTLAAMEPDTAYGRTALHQLFVKIQGENARNVAETLPIGYCKGSFEPIGAVARVHAASTIKYELTEEGAHMGKAVAGHMLDFSLRHPELSLRQVLGMTHGHDPELRSPMRRFEILQLLLTVDTEIGEAQVSQRTGRRTAATANHLQQMKQDGLISISEPLSTDYSVVYRGNNQISRYDPVAKDKKLSQNVVAIINELLSDDESVEQAVVEKLLRKDSDYGLMQERSLSVRVRYVLLSLQRQGLLQPVLESGKKFTSVRIAPKHEAALAEVVDIVNGLQENSPEFMQEGIRKANRIVTDDHAARGLVEKALQHSPQATGVPKEVRVARIMELVVSREAPVPSHEIMAAMQEYGVTKVSTKKTLAYLRESGLLKSMIFRGSELAWEASGPNQST